MAAGILVYTLGLTDSAIQARTATPSTVWLGGSAACDVIIAGCMLYFVSYSGAICPNTHRPGLQRAPDSFLGRNMVRPLPMQCCRALSV